MAAGEEFDSGMESQDSGVQEREGQSSPSSKTEGGSPSKLNSSRNEGVVVKDEEFEDEPDETLMERLWGLTEMFPDSVRDASYNVACATQSSVRGLYGFSRSAFWIVFSSSLILFAPVVVEVERVSIEESQRNQQKQMLLGPNTPMPGAGPMPMITSVR